MTKGKQLKLQLTRVKGRRVRVDFKGGEVTSDAGLLLIREVDRQLGLTERAARQLVDKRQKGKVRHEVLGMLRQRVYGLVAGYEDLNDFDTLRHDPLLQTVTGRIETLASAPTVCRFENGAGSAGGLCGKRAVGRTVHGLLCRGTRRDHPGL